MLNPEFYVTVTVFVFSWIFAAAVVVELVSEAVDTAGIDEFGFGNAASLRIVAAV